jgi:sporadic carbohydrate cluster 2OG-Fe(II) oxygenase
MLVLNSDDVQVIDNIHYLYKSKSIHSKLELISFCKKTLSDYLNCEIDDLALLHNYLNIQKVNDARLHLYHEINTNFSWQKCLFECIGSRLFELIGSDIMLQTRINVSIQLPHDDSSVLPMHSDCVSGDTPWQLNIWLPLTQAIKHNTMFLHSQVETLDYIKSIKSPSQDKDSSPKPESLSHLNKYWVEADELDVLIFNPAVLHGNTINTTSFSRLSLNVRAKSLFAPDALNSNPDRQSCTYYQPFNISANTSFAMNMHDLMHS